VAWERRGVDELLPVPARWRFDIGGSGLPKLWGRLLY
jgi:hypothetical protein